MYVPLVFIGLMSPPADQHLIEPGGEGVTAVANIDESRSTEYYGTMFSLRADSQAQRVLLPLHQIYTKPPPLQSPRRSQAPLHPLLVGSTSSLESTLSSTLRPPQQRTIRLANQSHPNWTTLRINPSPTVTLQTTSPPFTH